MHTTTNENGPAHQQAIASMMERSERAQAKLAHGTAQHTLLQNRLHALGVASALLAQAQCKNADAVMLSRAALERATAPLLSLISKSEKAREKLPPGSWQHSMLVENLCALHAAQSLLADALAAEAQSDAPGADP